MILRYFYDRKLAQASYLIGCESTGEAIVVDPIRQVDIYLQTAAAEGLQIVGALETHIHADFVSGAHELAERAQATLLLSGAGGEGWQYEYVATYKHRLLQGGDLLMLGGVKIDVLHVPGHTPEHLAFLVTDTPSADQPMGIFSGDFLFVGDVGRPDLLETAVGLVGTKETAARDLFSSLDKIRPLPDFLQVWPAHGAGSACGKSLGAVPSTTLGYKRRFNWAFQIREVDQFITSVLEGQVEPPRYFARMKQLNKIGPTLLDNVGPIHLRMEHLAETDLLADLVVDTRDSQEYASAFIPGTINIPFPSPNFLTYAGSVLPYDRRIAIIASETNASEILSDFQRIGLDEIEGFYNAENIHEWANLTRRRLHAISHQRSAEIAEAVLQGEVAVLDVRSETEYAEGHLPGAVNFALGDLPSRLHEIPRDKVILCQCQRGVRSIIAASILRRAGFENIQNLEGGFEAWDQTGQPILRS